MTEPNWSDFRIVLALEKGGSVTGAARLLGVDASTVSRRLIAAEEAFGAVPIARGGGAFRFTPEGMAVLKAAEAMETTVSTTTPRKSQSGAQPSDGVKTKNAPAGPTPAPARCCSDTTPANATLPSLTAAPRCSGTLSNPWRSCRHSLPARTPGRGRHRRPVRSPETRPCAHRNTPVGPCGDDGADITAEAAPRRRCIA